MKFGAIDRFELKDLDQPEVEGKALERAPEAIASFLLEQASSEFGWANDALYLACVEAMAQKQENAFARALLEEFLPEEHWREMHRADAVAVGRAMLAAHRMLSVSNGVLTATRLLVR